MIRDHAARRPLVVLAIGLSLLLSGCTGTSQSDLDRAKAAGASEEAAKQKQTALEQEQARLAAQVAKLQAEAAKAKVQATSKPAASQATPSPRSQALVGTSCGGNLSVASNTSCAFAANVESAFYAAGGGTNTVEVYSPVTGKYYVMTCVAGIPSVCRGGNNAVVYIR